MIYLDSIANKRKTKHNEKWPYVPDHPYRMLIIGGSDNVDKIYLYAKDLSKPKYEFLIKKCENAGSALILWMMFRQILIITTQSEKEKFSLFWIT